MEDGIMTEAVEMTEGERILKAARDLLNTVPPDDEAASYVSALIGLIDFHRYVQPVYFCEVCGEPARYDYKWKSLPRPDPGSVWVCGEHRDLGQGADECCDYGDFYINRASACEVG